jgi:hypothetical protein
LIWYFSASWVLSPSLVNKQCKQLHNDTHRIVVSIPIPSSGTEGWKCRKTFLFLYTISEKMLKNFKSSLLQHGLSSQTHGNTKRVPKNTKKHNLLCWHPTGCAIYYNICWGTRYFCCQVGYQATRLQEIRLAAITI